VAKKDIPSIVGRLRHIPRSTQIPSTYATIGRRAYTYLLTEKWIDSK